QAGLQLAHALALERAAFALAFHSGHPAEGIAAFLEKRKPEF
ncbi:MAG: enoyl-CoA hydratase, partial [Acidobacteria bacterium 37-65-4]